MASADLNGIGERFSLTRQFMIAATVVVLTGMTGMGTWVVNRIEEAIKEHAAAVTALHVDGTIAPLALSLLAQPSISPADRLALDERLGKGVLNRDLFAFKIWRPDGTIAYSSDPALIGKQFAPTPALVSAAAGQLHAEFDELDEAESDRERRAGVPLLEIYSPVRDPENGAVVGVVEFYEAASELGRELNSARIQTWLVVGVLTAGMLGLLYGIVARGGRLIAFQRRELAEKVVSLSTLLDQNETLQKSADTANRRAAALNERYLRRISSELHDGPLQLLAFASLRFGSKDRANAAAVKSAIDDAVREIRDISRGLTLPEIEGLTTSETIAKAISAHESRATASVDLELPDNLPELPQAEKICIYRFVQEGLNNAERHASASRKLVRATASPTSIFVFVEDNGRGLDPAKAFDGLGLSGLKERATGLGGSLDIDSTAAEGTRLTLQLRHGAPG